jgi:hypothetical protein
MSIARKLPALLGRDVLGQVIKAGRSYDLRPMPKPTPKETSARKETKHPTH